MPDAIPRGPFDQGLFLTHFNKGRDLYDTQRFADAERELEEAYLLRPRDQRVLNLLGLVYFKQDKLEKAEEVYRKLVTESPDANTLHYNLGLIYFKLNRLEDAESSFLKALDLSKGNPKINFYLGSIYERLHRHKDAIYQYRQAGANLMVRRVEDKMAASGPAKGAKRAGRKDDTAEFPKKDMQDRLRRHADDALARADHALAMGKVLQPISPALMTEGAPDPSELEPKVNLTDTARFRLREDTLPPRLAPAPVAAVPNATIPPFGSRDVETTPPIPLRPEPLVRRAPTEIFRFLDNNLMEID
ncbi:MAG: tetratricopeptide repeat protein, partial [Solirubrobacterales bacterium]